MYTKKASNCQAGRSPAPMYSTKQESRYMQATAIKGRMQNVLLRGALLGQLVRNGETSFHFTGGDWCLGFFQRFFSYSKSYLPCPTVFGRVKPHTVTFDGCCFNLHKNHDCKWFVSRKGNLRSLTSNPVLQHVVIQFPEIF